MTGVELVLASQSPRRLELLASIGLDCTVRPADVDETPLPGESPFEYVGRVARDKAKAIVAELGAPQRTVVLAADTTIDLDGEIVAKPADDLDGRRILRALSGRRHEVHTSVVCSLIDSGSHRHDQVTVTTGVTFVALTDGDIDWYLATGEHSDKAGAYGMQGAAGAFVARIDGSPSNVIGLPLAETRALLIESGVWSSLRDRR